MRVKRTALFLWFVILAGLVLSCVNSKVRTPTINVSIYPDRIMLDRVTGIPVYILFLRITVENTSSINAYITDGPRMPYANVPDSNSIMLSYIVETLPDTIDIYGFELPDTEILRGHHSITKHVRLEIPVHETDHHSLFQRSDVQVNSPVEIGCTVGFGSVKFRPIDPMNVLNEFLNWQHTVESPRISVPLP